MAAHARYLPEGETLPGLKVDGAVVGPWEDLRTVVAARVASLRARRVVLVSARDPRSVATEATLGDLGVEVDVERVLTLAKRLGHEGDLLDRASAAERARRGELDVPLQPAVNAGVALARIVAVKELEDVPPVSARLDLEHHDVTQEREGRYLDAYAALAGIERSSRDPALTTIEVAEVPFPPRMTSAFLKSLDIKSVLGSFETHFSRGGDQARRAQNIKVAASKLEGLVLTPGELLSFNEVVGERSEDNGFQKSWEIFKGEMTEGVGGGTCQVASTFHAAAFFGGLEVLERLPHSRPSAYIPMGLDSTVVYPAVDLKIRNPHAFPVVVHTTVLANTLKIELLGADKPARVSFKRELVKTYPYKRKVVEDDVLQGSKVVLKQHGIRGFRVKRTRELIFPDGSKKVEETTDTYPATTEIYEVPPGFDDALLPPLPEEAGKEVEPPPVAAAADAPVAAVSPSVPQALAPSDPPPVAAAGAPASAAPIAELRREAESRGFELVEAPGTHAPTKAQSDPPKELKIRR